MYWATMLRSYLFLRKIFSHVHDKMGDFARVVNILERYLISDRAGSQLHIHFLVLATLPGDPTLDLCVLQKNCPCLPLFPRCGWREKASPWKGKGIMRRQSRETTAKFDLEAEFCESKLSDSCCLHLCETSQLITTAVTRIVTQYH